MNRSATLAALLILAGTSFASAQTQNVAFKTTGFTQADFDRALEAFKAACPKLAGAWSDVVSVQGTFEDEWAPFRQAKGWKKTLHLAIQLSEKPTKLPAFTNDLGPVAGHTLHYDLGGGKEPGIFSTKRVSQFVCNYPIAEDGRHMFTPNPAFAFLTR